MADETRKVRVEERLKIKIGTYSLRAYYQYELRLTSDLDSLKVKILR